MRKTWQQKLDNGREPKVVVLEQPFGGAPAGARMLVATPRVVEQYLRHIPSGQTVPMTTLRGDLAESFHADVTCPLSTGIFIRIVAEAALEEIAAGAAAADVAPFWRVVDENSPAARRISCGPAFIRRMRETEASGRRAASNRAG
jgi:hypothetical protein